MLDEVVAIRFDRRMEVGRTCPLLLVAQRADGREEELVAKFSKGADIGAGGLIREALCAMLASDLGLPVPEPFLVRVDAEFRDAVRNVNPEVASLLDRSLAVGFGSRKLISGFSTWTQGRSIPKSMQWAAAEIFAFDSLIQNPDRRPERPNLFVRGESFAIFDHELALITEGLIGWRPPWEVGALHTAGQPDAHVFAAPLKGKALNLDRLIGAWESITNERLESYRNALPPEWDEATETAAVAIRFIMQLRDNIRPAIQEVMRVLT